MKGKEMRLINEMETETKVLLFAYHMIVCLEKLMALRIREFSKVAN